MGWGKWGAGQGKKMRDRMSLCKAVVRSYYFLLRTLFPLLVLYDMLFYLQSGTLGRTLLGTSHLSSSVSLRTDVGWALVISSGQNIHSWSSVGTSCHLMYRTSLTQSFEDNETSYMASGCIPRAQGRSCPAFLG